MPPLDPESKAFRDEVDEVVRRYAGADPEAYARRWKQLSTWGMDRSQGDAEYKKRLKNRLMTRSGGRCEDCGGTFERTQLEMHRLDTTVAFRKDKHFGYTDDNVLLLCAVCHDKREDEKRASVT